MAELSEEFMKRMHLYLGDEAASFLKSFDVPSPVSVRIHPLKGREQFINEEKVAWSSYGRYLSQRPLFTLDPCFHAGCYYVQEAGSMLVEELTAEIRAKMKAPVVLDLCAAPGGKSTHLLSLLHEDSVLVCNEPIPARNKTLRHNLAKWGYANIIVTQNEAAAIAQSAAKFDLILVDAPCSGEGLFRKDPESLTEWSTRQVEICAVRQKKILDEIIPALKPGGFLLYSTCTYEPAENDKQIEYLLHQYPFLNITPTAPEGIIETQFGWQAYPHRVRAEGFYCCLLQLQSDFRLPEKKEQKDKKEKNKNAFDKYKWLNEADKFEIFTQGDYLNAAQPSVLALTSALSGSCYLRQSGIPLGQMKGKDFIPSPELGLSLHLNGNLPQLPLTYNEALHFLKCEPVRTHKDEDGWYILTYDNHPLGWAKKIKQRWNNYFPKDWRIHMAIPQTEDRKK